MSTDGAEAEKAYEDMNFYDKWSALLRVGPTLPKEQGAELLQFVQAEHSNYQYLLALDRAGQGDIDLMNDLAERVDEQYRKLCMSGEQVDE